MSTTARVPKAALTGFQGRLLKAVVRRKVGRVPESLEVMWNHPAVLKDMAKLGGRTEKWGRLDETPGRTVFTSLERRVIEYAEAMSATLRQ